MKWVSGQVSDMVSALQKDMNGGSCTIDGATIGKAIIVGSGYIAYGLLRIAEAIEAKAEPK